MVMTIFGLDMLAGCKYAELAVKSLPQGFAFGTFINIFGDAIPLLERVAKSGKAPIIRVAGIWKDDHNYGQKEKAQAVKEAARVGALAKKYPIIDWRYSPFTEHNNSEKEMLAVMRDCQAVIGSVRLVNTPWKGAKLKSFINEIHGDDNALSPDYQFSYDGLSCVDSDAEKFKARHIKSDVFFLWTWQLNLKYSAKDTTPRPQRQTRPTDKLIKSLIALTKSKGQTHIPNGWIYKTHAEQHKPIEPRAGTMVLITPVHTSKINVIAANGKKVAEFKYDQPYNDGHRHIYRHLSYGYEVANSAKEVSGSPLCTLKSDGKTWGMINPAFREGEFKNN